MVVTDLFAQWLILKLYDADEKDVKAKFLSYSFRVFFTERTLNVCFKRHKW